MENLKSDKQFLEVRKQLIVAMAAEDPKLMTWLKGFVKVYGA